MPIQFPFLSAFTAKKPDYTRDLFFRRRFQSSAGIDCYNGHVLNFPGSDFNRRSERDVLGNVKCQRVSCS